MCAPPKVAKGTAEQWAFAAAYLRAMENATSPVEAFKAAAEQVSIGIVDALEAMKLALPVAIAASEGRL